VDRPTTVLFNGSKIAKMEDLAADKLDHESLNRSMSQLSFLDK
jgi:hypothetical protein